MALISCKNLSLGYEHKAILKNLSFEVNMGDYLCIVGENGSGKSTLMKALLHLRPQIEGEISFGDGLMPNEIGYLPQQTVVQKDFPASVYEIVLSGCQGRSGFFYSREDKQRARNAMERMNILELKNRCYRDLSGGQQQRVLLARALLATKKILLLDEPTSGLDPIVTSQMYELIWELNQKDEITIIMVSHDMNASLKYASHILHIGSEIYFGTKNDYLSSSLGERFKGFMGGEANEL